MRAALTIALLAAGISLATMSAREISEQVFIVTKGGESIKLGLVPVSDYDRETIDRVIRAIDEPLQDERDKTDWIITQIKKFASAASKENDQAFNAYIANSEDANTERWKDRAARINRAAEELELKAL
jgi:hypothetical protein